MRHEGGDGGEGDTKPTPEERVAYLEERVRYLESRLARHEPEAVVRIDELRSGPQ